MQGQIFGGKGLLIPPTTPIEYLISTPSNFDFSAFNTNFTHHLDLNREREVVMFEFWHHSIMVVKIPNIAPLRGLEMLLKRATMVAVKGSIN